MAGLGPWCPDFPSKTLIIRSCCLICVHWGLWVIASAKNSSMFYVSGQWCFSILPVLPVCVYPSWRRWAEEGWSAPNQWRPGSGPDPGKSVKGILSSWGAMWRSLLHPLTLQKVTFLVSALGVCGQIPPKEIRAAFLHLQLRNERSPYSLSRPEGPRSQVEMHAHVHGKYRRRTKSPTQLLTVGYSCVHQSPEMGPTKLSLSRRMLSQTFRV